MSQTPTWPSCPPSHVLLDPAGRLREGTYSRWLLRSSLREEPYNRSIWWQDTILSENPVSCFVVVCSRHSLIHWSPLCQAGYLIGIGSVSSLSLLLGYHLHWSCLLVSSISLSLHSLVISRTALFYLGLRSLDSSTCFVSSLFCLNYLEQLLSSYIT